MAKRSKSLVFKGASFKINENENGEKVYYIVEETKDDTLYTRLDSVLEMFAGDENLSISIKVDKEFDGE